MNALLRKMLLNRSLRPFRKALDLRRLIQHEIELQLRTLDATVGQEGISETLDKAVAAAAIAITSPGAIFDSERAREKASFQGASEKTFLENKKFVSENKGSFDRFYKHNQNEKIKTLLIEYLLVECYLSKEIKDEINEKYQRSRLQSLGSKYESLEIKEIKRKYNLHLEQVRKLRYKLSEREAYKIKIKFSTLLSVIAILTPLIFASGVIYIQSVYWILGSDASLFFDSSDYLSASLSWITPTIVYLIVSLIIVFLGYHDASRKPAALIKHERSKSSPLIIMVSICLILSTIGGLLIGGETLISSISLILFISTGILAGKVSEKYFKNETQAQFVIWFSFIFLIHLGANIMYKLNEVREAKPANVLLTTTNDGVYGDNEVFLSATAEHIIFWSPEDESVEAVQRNQIKSLKSIRTEESVEFVLRELFWGFLTPSQHIERKTIKNY